MWRVAIFVVLFLFLSFVLQGWTRWLGLDDRFPSGALGIRIAGFLLAALGASWFVMRRLEGSSLAALGLPWGARSGMGFGFGFAFGALIIGSAVVALAAAGWVSWVPDAAGSGPPAMTPLGVSGALAAGAVAEELLFRGYPLQVLAESMGGPPAIALTAGLFGVLHGANPHVGPLPLINVTLAGVLLGTAYWRTYSLWVVSGIHFGWNWVMGVAAAFPVSGLDVSPPGRAIQLHGPALWTGGDFGPEGGLAVTLISLAGWWWLARTPLLSRDERVVELGPLPDRRRSAESR
ncbi:MAG: lysostaphin resistance A-like protein [Gemmatimonadota bacterium]